MTGDPAAIGQDRRGPNLGPTEIQGENWAMNQWISPRAAGERPGSL
jgi:hypothetical protein